MRRRLLPLAVLGCLLTALLYAPVARRVRAARLLSALADQSASATKSPLVETDLVLPAVRARSVLASTSVRQARRRTGACARCALPGIDERRLVPSRASSHVRPVVLTPELRDLTDYRITRQGSSIIDDSVRYLSARKDVVTSPRVGLLGFSFAGGLALVAASESGLANHLVVRRQRWRTPRSRPLYALLGRDEIETVHGLQQLKAPIRPGRPDPRHLEYFVDHRSATPCAPRSALAPRRQAGGAFARLPARHPSPAKKLYQRLESGRLREFRPRLEAILTERRASCPSSRRAPDRADWRAGLSLTVRPTR